MQTRLNLGGDLTTHISMISSETAHCSSACSVYYMY